MKKLVLIALILHLLAAWFSYGRFHADEQYQVLEFIGYKQGINSSSELPWEFQEKIRATLQVSIGYGVIKTLNAFGISNPFTQTFVLRLLVSLLGFISSILLLKHFRYLKPKYYHLLVYLSLLWCFVPWFHARFSSENLSASLFIISLFIFSRHNLQTGLFEISVNKTHLFLIGLLMGLSGVVRFQLNFFIIGFVLWMIVIHRIRFIEFIVYSAGVLVAIGVGILSDKWFYGSWEITGWNYFYQNIILHKAENFGKEPIWYFFEHTLTDALPPFSLLIIASFLFYLFTQRKSIFSWLILVFLLAHFFSSHKEERFLFPLIPFVPVLFVLTFEMISESGKYSGIKKLFSERTTKVIRYLFVAINSILLVWLTFKPADDYTPVLKFLYNHYNGIETQMICESNEVNHYDSKVSLNFYRSAYIKVVEGFQKTDSVFNHFPQNNIVFISLNPHLNQIESYPVKKVYSGIPDWLYSFNFNNWIENSKPISIYQMQR